jgi:hypothetical protein
MLPPRPPSNPIWAIATTGGITWKETIADTSRDVMDIVSNKLWLKQAQLEFHDVAHWAQRFGLWEGFQTAANITFSISTIISYVDRGNLPTRSSFQKLPSNPP